MEIPDKQRFEHVEFHIENEILCCKSHQDECHLNDEGIRDLISTIEKMTNNKPMPLLIDIRKFIGNFDPSAAKIFANSPIIKKMILNQAFVVNTLNSKLLINSYKRIYVHESDIKIFSDMDIALNYCLETKNKFYAQ